MTAPARRDDLLVSIGVPNFAGSDAECDLLEALVRRIDARFRYWEIVLVVEDGLAGMAPALLSRIDNLRIVTTHRHLPFYRRRLVAASEAIGDVVALVDLDEMAAVDVAAMIETARATDALVVSERDQTSVLNPLLRTLGHLGGFQADVRVMLTTAYPRFLLNQLLRRADRELALRFPPAGTRWRIARQPALPDRLPPRRRGEWRRRLGLVYKLIVNSAPFALRVVALLSAAVAALGVLYVFYAIGAYLLLASIQPGWLTTSLLLGTTAGFIGVAMFGLAAGLHKALDLMTFDTAEDTIEEHSGKTLFAQVIEDLNVEVDLGGSPLLPPEPPPSPGRTGPAQ